MRTTLIIIALIISATIILVVFYQPANQLIKRTFTHITGMALVDSKTWDETRALNRILEGERDDIVLQRDSIHKEQKDAERALKQATEKHDQLHASFEDLKKELQDQEAVIDKMQDHEHLQAFDQMTEGSIITQTEGDRAMVEIARIRDANRKLNHRLHLIKVGEQKKEIIDGQMQIIGRMARVKSLLTLENENISKENAVLIKKNKNTEAAYEDMEEQANRKARIGYIVGAAGIIFGFVL